VYQRRVSFVDVQIAQDEFLWSGCGGLCDASPSQRIGWPTASCKIGENKRVATNFSLQESSLRPLATCAVVILLEWSFRADVCGKL
jgi:hypothetical protein